MQVSDRLRIPYSQSGRRISSDRLRIFLTFSSPFVLFLYFSISQDFLTSRSDAKSIFALLAPYSSREYANPMDVTGAYGGNITPLQESVDGPHYATAPFYKSFWGWRGTSPDPPTRSHFDNGDCTPNTLVFQVRGETPLKPPASLLKLFF